VLHIRFYSLGLGFKLNRKKNCFLIFIRMSKINFKELCTDIINDRQKFLRFCEKYKLLPKNMWCPNCWEIMPMNHKSGIYQSIGVSRCGKNSCRGVPGTQISITKNSWFYNSNLNPETILLFTYCFANGITKYEDIKRECNLYRPDMNGHIKSLGDKAIASKLKNFFLCQSLSDNNKDGKKILGSWE
jgi:hypothetical protein